MNKLSIPPLLSELITAGRWKQPSDKTITTVIPFLREPVDFFMDIEQMQRVSLQYLPIFLDPPNLADVFHVYRGSNTPAKDLPWLDVEKSLLIAGNRISGDDVAIILDYRTDLYDPRVVANDWWTENNTKCLWTEVESKFSKFVQRIGI